MESRSGAVNLCKKIAPCVLGIRYCNSNQRQEGEEVSRELVILSWKPTISREILVGFENVA